LTIDVCDSFAQVRGMLEQLRLSQNWMLSDYLIDILKTKICSHWGIEAIANLSEMESCDLEQPSLETFAVIAIKTIPKVTVDNVLSLPDRASIIQHKVSCMTPMSAPLTPMYTPFMQGITSLIYDAQRDAQDDSHATLVAVAWKLLDSQKFEYLRSTIGLLDKSFGAADCTLWNQWLRDYVLCTLNPGTQQSADSFLFEIEREIMFSIAQAHVKYHIGDRTFSPLLCTVFLQSVILQNCVSFVRYLRIWSPCHHKFRVESLKQKLKSVCGQCPMDFPLIDMMKSVQSYILESGIDCIFDWFCDIVGSDAAGAEILAFLAAFMPIMRDMRAGPLANFFIMTKTLQDHQNPALYAKVVVLFTFSMIFSECCDSVSRVCINLNRQFISAFIGQVQFGSDFLPLMLEIVSVIRLRGRLTVVEQDNLLIVIQDIFFWILNGPKITGKHELSDDTCAAILCGTTLCNGREFSQDRQELSKAFCLIRDSVKLLSESARFSLLSCGLEYGHLNIELINNLLGYAIQPAPNCCMYIPDFVLSAYLSPAIQRFKQDITASLPDQAPAASRSEVQPWNASSPALAPVALMCYNALMNPALSCREDEPALTIDNLVQRFLDDQAKRELPRQLGLSIRAAIYAVEICKQASRIPSSEFLKEVRCLQVLKFLFEEHPAWSIFFIVQIQGIEARTNFLRNVELCDRISLPGWLRLGIAQSRSDADIIFAVLPCQIHLNDPWNRAYSAALALVKNLNAHHNTQFQSPQQKKSAITAWALEQQQQGSNAAYRARGLLLLALFDEVWQLQGTNAECVAEWATLAGSGDPSIPENARLFLNPDVAHVIATIARGPRPYEFKNIQAESHWAFQWIFSRDSFIVSESNLEIDRIEDKKLRSAFIAVLAMDIGSPSNLAFEPCHSSNRLYYTTCLLRPQLLPGSWGLGTGYGQLAKDCGLQTAVDKNNAAIWSFYDVSPVVPPFPHSNPEVTKASRLMNNTMICSSWAWNLFFWPERHTVYHPRTHIFTHSENDARELKYGRWSQQILQNMHLCNSLYAAARSTQYLQYFREQQQQLEASREPLVAWGCCVQSIWALACSPADEVPELAGQYKLDSDVDQPWRQRIRGTMTRFADAVDHSIQREPELRRLYVEKMSKDLKQKALLSALDEATVLVERCHSSSGTLASFDSFLSSLKSTLEKSTFEGKDTLNKRCAKVLLHLLDRSMRDPADTPHRMFVRADLHMMSHAPKLITMYEWATKAFAFRYEESRVEEQASEFLEDAIASLPIGKREVGHAIYQEFLRCWKELQEHFQNYMQCGHELAENSYIPMFVSKDDDPNGTFVRVHDVVSLRDDENEEFGAGCHLIRMLKKLLQMQDDALKLPDLLTILDTESPDSINRFACCAQPIPDFDMRVSEIPKHEWSKHLLTAEFTTLGFDENCEVDDSPLQFAIIANSRMVDGPGERRCQYNYQAITRIVLRHIIDGRFPLTIMTDLPGAPPGPAFFRTLQAKPALEVIGDADEAVKLDGKKLEEYARKRVGELSGVADLNDDDLKLLCVQCAQLRRGWTKPLSSSEVSKLQCDISEMPGEHVALVVQHLITIVTFVLGIRDLDADKSFCPQDTIENIMNSDAVRPHLGWNQSFSRFRRYKLESLQDLGYKVIAGIPSRDFSTHYGLNDKLPVEQLQRLQRIEHFMLQDNHEHRAKYFEALTVFASQLHSVIRRVSQHESPDKPLSEIDDVKEILPRVHLSQSIRIPGSAKSELKPQISPAVDDRTLCFLIEMG
jgi:hypothetical protein